MDLGNIVYIIAVIAYFIYQATKKKGAQDIPESNENQPEPPQKGLTFEEILREIRNAQNPPASETPRPPKPEPAKPSPLPPHLPQAKSQKRDRFEPVEEMDDEATFYEGSYAASKKNPYMAHAPATQIPSLSERKIDYDALTKKKINPYAEKLKNPQNVKEAIILSEILQRKHF